MKKVLIAGAVSIMSLLPVFALAQGASSIDTSGLIGTVKGLTNVVNYAIPFFLAIAVIAFIIGVIKYLFAAGANEKIKAKEFLVSGVIAITVILAVFGIARLLINLFGLSPAQLDSSQIPSVASTPTVYGGNQ